MHSQLFEPVRPNYNYNMVTVYPGMDEAQGFIVNTWTFTGAGTSGVERVSVPRRSVARA